jgi:PAS domain S-box-containing protein
VRIRSQLLLILTGIVLVPLFVAGVLLHNAMSARLLALAQNRLHLRALNVAAELNSSFRKAVEAVQATAEQPMLIEYLAGEEGSRERLQAGVNHLLRAVAVHDPANTNSCALFDARGTKLADSSIHRKDPIDESTMPWISGPLTTGTDTVDTTTAGPVGRAIWIGVPMQDTDGQINGVLRLRLEISMLQQTVAGITEEIGDDEFAIVVDDDSGTILAHGADPSRIGDPVDTIVSDPSGEVTRGPRTAMPARGKWSHESKAGGPPDHLSIVKLELAPWRAGIVQTDEAFGATRNGFLRTLIALGAVVTGLILVTGLIASHWISRPISELAKAANDIDAGQLDRVVPAGGAKEVRALTCALNNMTGRLSRSVVAIEERAAEFQAIFDGSPLAMALSDGQQKFAYLNRSFEKLFGYTRSDVPDLETWWMRACPDVACRAEATRLFNEQIATAREPGEQATPAIEATVTCKDGFLRHIEFRSIWMGDKRLTTFIDLTPHKHAQRVREILLELLGGLSGRAFFERLALETAALFSAERVFIGRFIAPGSDEQEPLVVWQRGEFVEGNTQHTTGGPCEVMVRERHFMFWPDVAAAFPERAQRFRDFGIVAFAGLPLRNLRGEVVGTISVMFAHPLNDAEPVRTSLELLASRAAMELDRLAAADTLSASEERYRSLVTHAPDAIVVLDADTGRFVDCNANAEKLFKLSRDELLQRGPIDLSPATQSDGQATEEVAGSYIREALCGRLQTFEWLHKDSTGAVFPCEVRLVRLPDPNLRLLRGSILDLSQNKRALAELQQSERRFAAIFNESPVGMAITSIEESTVLDANFAVCRMLGITREQALSSSTLDYTSWEPGERESLVKELVAGSPPAMIEKSLRRSDGRSIVAQMQFTVVELGGLKRLLVAISDVTERNRAEDILRENEERFRLLVEGSNELVVLLEPTGTVLYASPNHVTITGFTPEELAGSSFLEHVHPDEVTAVASQLEKVSTAITYRSRFKDRSWHWIESSGRNFSLSSGERRGVVVSRDISARIAAEEARKALETQLRQSQKLEAIGTLAGGIAHDFNNILTGVMGHLELVLLELPKSHVLRPQLDNAFNSCKRARSLISQILTFSRQKEPTRQSAHIGPVIHEAIRLLRASLPATIEIDLDVDDDTPAIDCDVTQIHQLVMNLATNAAHAMAGGGRLTVSLYCVAPDADALRSNVDLCAEHTVRAEHAIVVVRRRVALRGVLQ